LILQIHPLFAAGLITTSAGINYESIPSTSFTFLVTVSDGTATDMQPITIDVINVNEAPAFSQMSYSLSTTEGAVSQSVSGLH